MDAEGDDGPRPRAAHVRKVARALRSAYALIRILVLAQLADKAQLLVKWASGMSDFGFIVFNVTGLLLMFLLAVLLLDGKPRLPVVLTLFTGLFALLLITEFEIVRENIRKPYVIYNYMYANGVLKEQMETLKRDGAFTHAVFTDVREITQENQVKAGEELFRMQCIACHSIDGVRRSRAMTNRVKGWSEEAIAGFVPYMHEVRDVMPPFAGSDEELKALAAYLHNIVSKHNESGITDQNVSARKKEGE